MNCCLYCGSMLIEGVRHMHVAEDPRRGKSAGCIVLLLDVPVTPDIPIPSAPKKQNIECTGNGMLLPKKLFMNPLCKFLCKNIDKIVNACLFGHTVCTQCIYALKQVLARPYRYAYVNVYVGNTTTASISQSLSLYLTTNQLYCRCNQSVVRTIAVTAAGMLQIRLHDVTGNKK